MNYEFTEKQILQWAKEWLETELGTSVDADTPLVGNVSSLTLARLLVAAEYTWNRDLSNGLSVNALNSVSTLASYISNISEPSRRAWYEPRRNVGSYGHDFNADVVTADIHDGETKLGVLRASSLGELGSILRYGHEAEAAGDVQQALEALVRNLGGTLVWYPLLTQSSVGRNHVQSIHASFSSGHLPHAACLELLTKAPTLPDSFYGGLGYAFRREPARVWNPRGRLEAYRVFEIVWVGSSKMSADAWRLLQDEVGRLLSILVGPGAWAAASDGFTDGIKRKLEWRADRSTDLALASLNEHAESFTGVEGRVSFCLGVGIDRILATGLLQGCDRQ